MEKRKFPSFVTIAVNNVLGVCHLKNNSQGEFHLAEGTVAELLPILATTLKFKYKLIAPQDRQWGKKEPNGNWTGMIGLVQSGEADMATCDIIISEERREVIDYSYPYDILEMVFANKAPELLPKFFACFYPFSFGLWLAILGLIITMPFFWRFLFSTKISPIQLLGNVYYTILSGAASIRIVSLRDYVLLGTWIAAISFLSRSYTAVLLSFLTLPLQESIVRDIPQLSNAIMAGNYRSLTFKGTMVQDMIKASPRDTVQLIGRAIDKNEWFVKPLLEDAAKAIAEGNTAVIAMKPFFTDHYSSSAVAVSYDHFSVAQFGIVLKKQFCCKEALDYKLSLILAAGILEKCKRHYRFRVLLKLNENNAEMFEFISPLSMENISGALLIHFVGICLALIIFMFEIFCVKRNVRCKSIL